MSWTKVTWYGSPPARGHLEQPTLPMDPAPGKHPFASFAGLKEEDVKLMHPYGREPIDAGRAIGQGTAILAIGAGVIHVSAAFDHAHHPAMATGFVVFAVLQVGLGLLLLWRRPSRNLLLGGVAMMAAGVAVWLVSRTVGLEFAGQEGQEGVGVADAVTVLFELGAIPGLLLLADWESHPITLPSPRFGLRSTELLGVLAIALYVPAVTLGGGSHGHGGGHDAIVLADGAHGSDHDPAAGDGTEHASAGHARGGSGRSHGSGHDGSGSSGGHESGGAGHSTSSHGTAAGTGAHGHSGTLVAGGASHGHGTVPAGYAPGHTGGGHTGGGGGHTSGGSGGGHTGGGTHPPGGGGGSGGGHGGDGHTPTPTPAPTPTPPAPPPENPLDPVIEGGPLDPVIP